MPLTTKQHGNYQVHSHHIFPNSILFKNGYNPENHIDKKIVNEIANRAFLTADSNISLSNSLPEDYLPEIEEKYPGALVKQCIPMQPELWKLSNYRQFLEARRTLLAFKFNEYFQTLITKPISVKEKSTAEIIKLGENTTLEFKGTLQWDIIKNEKNTGLRKSVLKTIAAFLNSNGGTLVIGVDDRGNVLGLERDFSLVDKAADGFMNLLNNLIGEHIGKEYAGLISIKTEELEGRQVCVINVDHSSAAAYLSIEGKKEFYIRMGNTTQSLDPEETVNYISLNFS